MNIYLTCVGGPLDGKYEFPDYSPGDQPSSADPNRLAAWMLLSTTGGGQPGRSSGGMSPAMLGQVLGGVRAASVGGQPHSYAITQRREEGDSAFVTAKLIAAAPSEPKLISEYTVEQMVNELIRRPEFVGVIAYASRSSGSPRIKAGEKITTAANLQKSDAIGFLREVIQMLGG